MKKWIRSAVIFCLLILLPGCNISPMKADYINTQEKTENISETSNPDPEDDDIINSFTDDQILSAAREIYSNCLSIAEQYLSGSVFDVDTTESAVFEGKTYFPVSDSRVSDFDDIYSEWMNVFSSKYIDKESEMFSLYCFKNDRIWVQKRPYKADSSYIDTVLIKILSRNGNEAEISAVSTYQREEGNYSKSENVFSVVYSSDAFRAGKFTMPF